MSEIWSRGEDTPGMSPALRPVSSSDPFPVRLYQEQPTPVVKCVSLIDATPVLSVAATYASGDYVGESGKALLVPNVFRTAPGGLTLIQSLVVIDKVASSVAGELWLFDEDPVPGADSGAWSITDVRASASLLGVVPVATYYASSANSVGQVLNVGLVVRGKTHDLYACFVTRGAPSYGATGDLSFRLGVVKY